MRWTARSTTRWTTRRLVVCAALTAVIGLGLAGAATESPSPSGHVASGREQISEQEVSVQLFNFFAYIGYDSSPAAQARQEEVLHRLAAIGYQNVEAVDSTNFQGLGADGFRALLDENHLTVSALHTSMSMATTDDQWDATLTDAETLGAPFVGAGANPQTFTTREQWVAFAQKIDHLGELARARGMRYLVHSHDWEFTSVFGDETAYDILQTYTRPQNVVFELDLYWVTKAGADPVDLFDRYGDRIQLLHVKDMAEDGSITTVGEGTIDFEALVAAAGQGIRYYVVERDPPFDDPTFDPFGPAASGLEHLSALLLSSRQIRQP